MLVTADMKKLEVQVDPDGKILNVEDKSNDKDDGRQNQEGQQGKKGG